MNDSSPTPTSTPRRGFSKPGSDAPSGQPASSGLDFSAPERATLDQALRRSPFSVVLGMAGHSRACILRIRSGRSLVCSCNATQEASDDAAAAVGLAIHFARMTEARQIPMPPGVIARLIEHVDAGNAAASLVWEWLVRRGQITEQDGSAPTPRPSIRIVSERS